MEPAESVEFDVETDPSCLVLRENLKHYVSFYCFSFRRLNDTHERHAGENLESKVNLILTNPRYNMRRNQGRQHSTHESFYNSEMVKLVDIADFCLVPGGQLFSAHSFNSRIGVVS